MVLAKYNRRTIKHKLFMLLSITTSIAVLLACIVFVAFTAFSARKMLEEDLALLSRVLSEKLALTLVYDRPETATESLTSLQEKPSVLKACIFNQQGELFSHYVLQGTCPTSPSSLEEYHMEQGRIYNSYPVSFNEEEIVGVLYLESNTKRMTTMIKQTVINAFIVFLVTTLLGLLLSRKMQRSIENPLTELINISRQVKAGNYSVRATYVTNDEIGKLAKTFNRMIATIGTTTTELEQANNALHLAIERANRMSEFRTRWTRNISHEMRTPIHGTLSYIEFTREGLKEGSAVDKNTIEYLEKAEVCARNLNTLIVDLLDFSAFETNNMKIDTEQHNFSDIIEHCVKRQMKEAETKKQTITISHTPKDSRAFLNPEKMKQLVVHLLNNATAFSPENSAISISLEKTSLTDNTGRKVRALKLSVEDEGCGIPEEELDKVFEPFTESSRTAKESGGKGLGLSLCKEIIYAHNGNIWLENNQKKGITVHAVIPTHV